MSASTPDNFYSFADFMGLNDEAGQSMLDRTMGDYSGPNAKDIRKLSNQNYAGAADIGQGNTFDQTANGVRTGLASYGAFLKGLSDPTARQALLEKTYGKGEASWLDSTLTGAAGGGRLGAMSKELGDLQRSTEAQGVQANARRGDARSLAAQEAANKSADIAMRQKAQNQKEAGASAAKSAADKARMQRFGDWLLQGQAGSSTAGGINFSDTSGLHYDQDNADMKAYVDQAWAQHKANGNDPRDYWNQYKASKDTSQYGHTGVNTSDW